MRNLILTTLLLLLPMTTAAEVLWKRADDPRRCGEIPGCQQLYKRDSYECIRENTRTMYETFSGGNIQQAPSTPYQNNPGYGGAFARGFSQGYGNPYSGESITLPKQVTDWSGASACMEARGWERRHGAE